MSCSKCCGFKPFFGKVDYVIRDYDPTEDFTDYTVPTWWINRKRKVAWFLVSKEGGKAVWVPLLFGAFINKILTRCGEILPENGQIEFKEGEGIVFACDGSKLTFSLAIPILAEYGGTGFTEYKLGDLLVGNLDGTLSKLAIGEKGKALGVKDDGTLGYIDIVQKLNCSEDDVTENALARWNADGKCLKDSKIKQDDQGNTTTTSTVDEALKQTLKNLSTNDLAQALMELVTSEKGTPILKLLAEQTQQYQIYINRNDKSLMIAGHNFQDPTQSNNFFQITRRGAVKNLNQPQGLIILENSTGDVTGNNNWYRLGNTETWTVIFDNYKIFTSLGGSPSNPLKAILNEGGSFQFKIGIHVKNRAVPANQTFFQFRILTKGREYFSFGNTAAGLSDGYLSDNIGVIADVNDELFFELWGGIAGPQTTINIIGTKWPILHTGIFYYLMG